LIVEHPANRPVWRFLKSAYYDNILVEQYFLAACLHFHKHRATSPYSEIDIRYVFDSSEAAFREKDAQRLGYTHLIGSAKSDPIVTMRLEDRVRRDYPELYERVMECCAGIDCL
jgi:hypothetical protein